jgi:hypothetical protein
MNEEQRIREDLESTVLEAIMPRDWNTIIGQPSELALCCHIPCDKLATYIVHHDCVDMYCVTEACEDHLGAMLGCTADPPEEKENYHVIVI